MATNVGAAIKSILDDDAGVGTAVANRIYYGVAPQENTLPYITFEIVSNIPYDTKDGPSTVDQVRVQVNSWAKIHPDSSGETVEAINSAVRSALDRYTPATVNGVVIDGIRYETERDMINEDQDSFGRSADYFIRIKYP